MSQRRPSYYLWSSLCALFLLNNDEQGEPVGNTSTAMGSRLITAEISIDASCA